MKERDKMKGIYKIANKVNNRVYIGKSVDIGRRWREHIVMLEAKTHHSHKLQEDFNTYGILNFDFCIICICNTDELKIKEKEFVDMYDSLRTGYNVAEIFLPHDIYDVIEQTNGKIERSLLSDRNRKLLREKIILFDEKNKMNIKYADEFDLSYSWFNKENKQDEVELLKKDLYNYCNNYISTPDRKYFSWTTYYGIKENLKTKGSTKKYTSIGCDNNTRKSKYLAFLCNVFVNEFKIRDLDIEIDLPKEKIPLMVLVRWILANMDKEEDEIVLYLPSGRMRRLFENWVNGGCEND